MKQKKLFWNNNTTNKIVLNYIQSAVYTQHTQIHRAIYSYRFAAQNFHYSNARRTVLAGKQRVKGIRSLLCVEVENSFQSLLYISDANWKCCRPRWTCGKQVSTLSHLYRWMDGWKEKSNVNFRTDFLSANLNNLNSDSNFNICIYEENLKTKLPMKWVILKCQTWCRNNGFT